MKLDRLLGILTILLQNSRITAPQLAQRFEVSRRTIERDIDALCRAGIPVVTYQGGGGGISIADGYKLDKSVLTSDELSGIIAALRGIGSVSEKSRIECTLDKLVSNRDAVLSLRESIVIDLASHYKVSLTPKIALIKQAVLEQRLIEFDYYYERGQAHRQIEPYFIIFQWTAWYVFGFCTEQQDWRMFKLARLWELKLSEETHIRREIPPEKRDFSARFPDDNKLIALFDQSVKYQLIEEYGLHCFTQTEDGELRFENGYTNPEHMVSWLLGFGDKVTVLEPGDMVERIRQTAKKIVERYS